jgi:hypothetical protein
MTVAVGWSGHYWYARVETKRWESFSEEIASYWRATRQLALSRVDDWVCTFLQEPDGWVCQARSVDGSDRMSALHLPRCRLFVGGEERFFYTISFFATGFVNSLVPIHLVHRRGELDLDPKQVLGFREYEFS